MKTPKTEIRNPKLGSHPPLLIPNDKPYDLRKRAFLFALRIIKIAAALPNSPEARIVRTQLVKAGTSIGANVQEADGAVSKADTRRSFVIAKKEAQETHYWLQIVDATWGKTVDVNPDLSEASELTLIIATIIRNLER